MEKKVTAVDILYKFLYEMESFEGFDPYDFNQEKVFAKAKEMEKQQIIYAYKNGARYALISQSDLALIKGKFPSPEEYYNETFKTESINN